MFAPDELLLALTEHLRTMKRAANRPQDLEDLKRLDDDRD
jgi:hypothetical protein